MGKIKVIKLRRLFFCTLFSLALDVNARQGSISLINDKEAGIEWQLKVKDADLISVFDEVTQVGKARIHYSAIPQLIVTATCVASTLEGVLKCLMGSGVNMVFRYSSNDGQADKLIDVWILGSTLVSSNASNNNLDCKPVENAKKTVVVQSKTDNLDNNAQFIKLVTSFEQGNPKQRALVLADLISNTNFDKTEIESVLQKAMYDDSAIVRMQALFGYVRRFGVTNVRMELQQALNDIDAKVRMKAVEFSEDPLLWQQAISDENESVRWLAQHKLDAQKNGTD